MLLLVVIVSIAFINIYLFKIAKMTIQHQYIVKRVFLIKSIFLIKANRAIKRKYKLNY